MKCIGTKIGSCLSGVDHAGVGCVMLGWGGVGHVDVGLDGSCRGGVVEVGHVGVGSGGSYTGGMGWVMKNIKLLVLQGI